MQKIDPVLKTLQDDYFMIGASALALSGIPIENTYDIDILTSTRDAYQLQSLWREKQMESHFPANPHLFRSVFARFHFEILDVEVMGDLEIHKNNNWIPLQIQEYTIFSTGNFQIKIPTLQEQKRIFLLFGREKDLEKVKLLEKALQK